MKTVLFVLLDKLVNCDNDKLVVCIVFGKGKRNYGWITQSLRKWQKNVQILAYLKIIFLLNFCQLHHVRKYYFLQIIGKENVSNAINKPYFFLYQNIDMIWRKWFSQWRCVRKIHSMYLKKTLTLSSINASAIKCKKQKTFNSYGAAKRPILLTRWLHICRNNFFI